MALSRRKLHRAFQLETLDQRLVLSTLSLCDNHVASCLAAEAVPDQTPAVQNLRSAQAGDPLPTKAARTPLRPASIAANEKPARTKVLIAGTLAEKTQTTTRSSNPSPLSNGQMEVGTNLNFVYQEEATNLLSEPDGIPHANGANNFERRAYVFRNDVDWANAYDFNPVTGLSNSSPWRQEFLDDLKIYSQLRFLHWTNTNGSGIQSWGERTDPNSDQRQLSEFGTATGSSPNNGIAWEWIVDLGNRLKKDVWINIPLKADDVYVQNLANLMEERLDPELHVYVEYHNEIWLTKPVQGDTQNTSEYSEAMAVAENIDNGVGGFENVLRWYAHRSAEVWSLFRTEFGTSFDARVFEVAAGQNANVNLGEQIRDFLRDGNVNTTSPTELEDAFAIAPYFGDGPITPATTFSDLNSLANAQVSTVASHVAAWRSVGTPVIAYEGGQSISGLNAEPDELVHDFNTDPRMKKIYSKYLKGLNRVGLESFTHFTHSGTSLANSANTGNDWGAKAYIGQPASEAPKFAALAKFAGFKIKSRSASALIHDGAVATFDTAGSLAGTTTSIAADPGWIPQVTTSDVVAGPGVDSTNAYFINEFSTSGWDSSTLGESIANDEYIGFSITVDRRHTLDASVIDLILRSQNQPRDFALLSSATGFDVENVLSDFGGTITTTTGQNVAAHLSGIAGMQNLRGTIEFRIYAYNATPNTYEAIGIGNRIGFDLKLSGQVTNAGSRHHHHHHHHPHHQDHVYHKRELALEREREREKMLKFTQWADNERVRAKLQQSHR